MARLVSGKPGESELEFIYRTRPGPVSRKWAIWELGQRRISEDLKKLGGMIDYEVIANDQWLTFELTWGENYEALRFGPRAQRKIDYPVLLSERPNEPPPDGRN